MKVLVEILHPAHVHFFRHAIRTWLDRGDDVLVLSREKECANDLLEAFGIPYTSISSLPRTQAGLLLEMLRRDWRMARACARFKPDVLVGIMGVTIAQVGRLTGRPAIVFYDTENAALTNRFVYPLASAVCTPACYQGKVHGNHVTYPGYHELAYLHPNRFSPDPAVLRKAGLTPGEDYFMLRLVSWQASHDVGENGLTVSFVRRLVEMLAPHGRVLISSEGALPHDLEPHAFRPDATDMHHVLAFAKMLVGESATMASEAAVLGVPALFISDTGRGYTDEEEREYGLVFNFKRNETSGIESRITDLLSLPDLRQEFGRRRQRLLDEKVDTTGWIIDYVDRFLAERDAPRSG
ncbi:MAG: DUF354 domain-containing protein [Lentisphaerae bacterium]|nr:DUF354 domain-containing protein [Lentisphaerota bacterium]